MRKLNQRGFTLAELLIVVAIIAVMVAVSIPVFTSQLEKSREQTDMANLRSAYAIVQTSVLTEDYKTGSGDSFKEAANWNKSGQVYYAFYDIKKGELVKSSNSGTTGKGTPTQGGAEKYSGPIYYTDATNAKTRNLFVYIKENAGNVAEDTGVGFTSKTSGYSGNSSDFT